MLQVECGPSSTDALTAHQSTDSCIHKFHFRHLATRVALTLDDSTIQLNLPVASSFFISSLAIWWANDKANNFSRKVNISRSHFHQLFRYQQLVATCQCLITTTISPQYINHWLRKLSVKSVIPDYSYFLIADVEINSSELMDQPTSWWTESTPLIYLKKSDGTTWIGELHYKTIISINNHRLCMYMCDI